jgi:hypothetical protein
MFPCSGNMVETTSHVVVPREGSNDDGMGEVELLK